MYKVDVRFAPKDLESGFIVCRKDSVEPYLNFYRSVDHDDTPLTFKRAEDIAAELEGGIVVEYIKE